jgi:hypothetical protein
VELKAWSDAEREIVRAAAAITATATHIIRVADAVSAATR